MICVAGSNSIVQGASSSDATYSESRREGTVTLPSSRTVAGTRVLMVRSRFVAVTRSPSISVSKSTLPSTGSVEREETARETRARQALSADGETVHLMAEWPPTVLDQLFTAWDS